MTKQFHQTKSTVSIILALALLLSAFVSGTNYVSANSSSTDDDPITMSSTYSLMQTTATSPIFKVIEDFEGGNVNGSFIRAKGTFNLASKPEPVLYGQHSAKLNYTFVDVETGTSAAYLNFTDPGTSNYRTLEGKPSKLGLWVYGDGNNKHWLRAEFNSAPNNVVVDFTGTSGFNWSGWRYVVVNVPAKLTSPDFKDPITLRRIYITQTSEINKTNGFAYFDRVSVFYGDTGGLYGLDLLGLTPMKVGEAQTAQVFETREGYTAPKLVTAPVTFNSSDEHVATVDSHGNVTAISKGVTTITASYGALSATYEMIVSNDAPIVEQLYFTGINELKMYETAQTELFASIQGMPDPIRILSGATYSSDNEAIATIDEHGLITARSVGRTTLRASYGNQSASFELGVGVPVPILQNIKLTGLTSIEIGESEQAKVIGMYDIEPLEVELKEGVTFTSSAPGVATIDSHGVIQGKSLGISLITAKYNGKSAVYTVVVNKPNLQPPKRELRAAWISTVEKIDWPKSTNPEQQKQEFIDLLDFHKSLGMNAVLVQIKPTADAFYKSELAPWSHWITGVQGKDPGYDPLAFMIEEAHKRNLEFHAWFNPYRISMDTKINNLVEDHPARQHPDWVMEYGGKLYYDPGVPEAIQYITDSVMEVVKNYDVDGVHFDDYFYPNRFDGEGYPDQATYDKYGKDYSGGINAWRRHNVDTLIYNLSKEIKAEKSYVKFGISPFGVWRNKSVDPNGSDTNAGQPSYDNLHADIRKWVLEGWIDYVTPQIYWSFGFSPAAYEILVDWWNELIEQNNANTHLYIGHADYKVNSDANFIDPYEIPNQLNYNLNFEQVKGSIHFTTRDLIGKPELREKIAEVYKYPSLVPVMPWLETKAPEVPTNIKASSHPSGIQVKWTDTDDSTTYYVIYRTSSDQVLDMDNPAHILTTLRKADLASYVDQEVTLGETYTYAVTAVDRLHNESTLSEQKTVTKTEQNSGNPATSLTGAGTVKAGDLFKVTYGLNVDTSSVYAQDITIEYDENIMTFDSVESVKENLVIVGSVSDQEGKLRFILSSTGNGNGVSGQTDLIEISFKAKDVQQTSAGTIRISSAVVADEYGLEMQADTSQLDVSVVQRNATDVNGDGKTSIGDLALVALHYGKSSSSPDWEQARRADINGDGIIDILDLADVAAAILE